MEIKIREYLESDAPEVKSVFAEFVEYHSQLDNCYCKIADHCDLFIEFIESGIKMNNDYVTVAQSANKIVGYCVSKIEHKPPIYPVPTYGYIDNTGVLSAYQKNGVGTMLLDDAVKWFKKKEIKRIECFASIANIKSTSFWRKMGFRVFMEQMYLDL